MRSVPWPLAWVLAVLALLGGAYLEARGWGPVALWRSFKHDRGWSAPLPPHVPHFDGYGRLTHYPGKVAVPCPAMETGTEVLLLLGQSNAANHAGQSYATQTPGAVVNLWNGSCYQGASPLLGSSAAMGDPWVLLADRLRQQALARQVVLVSSAIGATRIGQWAPGGDLHALLHAVIGDVHAQGLRITRVLWVQGESDAAHTSAADYRKRFLELLGSLRAQGVEAPVYVAVTSFNGFDPSWTAGNPVADAQRTLPDVALGLYAGVNLDALLAPTDRYDGTHLSASGVDKMAQAWVEVLARPLLGVSCGSGFRCNGQPQ